LAVAKSEHGLELTKEEGFEGARRHMPQGLGQKGGLGVCRRRIRWTSWIGGLISFLMFPSLSSSYFFSILRRHSSSWVRRLRSFRARWEAEFVEGAAGLDWRHLDGGTGGEGEGGWGVASVLDAGASGRVRYGSRGARKVWVVEGAN
jgi:hypothetical protein